MFIGDGFEMCGKRKQNKGYILEIGEKSLKLNSKPFYLASGEMHYFRFFKDGWRRRLKLMKDFGLTAVQTYVPWNLHEKHEGEFDFSGNLDLAAFLELCDEIGLKVMFRPSPYMCTEWNFGGLPYWLLNKKGIGIRTSDPIFAGCIKKYYERLAKEFVPYLSTNGGPIIAVAVENEYGSYSDDGEYVKMMGDLLKEIGVDVPLYTANGWEPFKLKNGSRKEYWTAFDTREITENIINAHNEYQPDKPLYNAEFWDGGLQQWGGYFQRISSDDVTSRYKESIEMGAFVNFYMFCGGTNFGFNNGALVGRYEADRPEAENRYIPYITSYDYDAPINEQGEPTEKYFACKKILMDYLTANGFEFGGTNEFEYNAADDDHLQRIDNVKMNRSADLLQNIDALAAETVRSSMPMTMEDLNQDSGFILYSTEIRYTDTAERFVNIFGLHDRATVYANGIYAGTYMRDKNDEPIKFTVPEAGLKLDILVENLGRVNYGNAMYFDKKGICDYVKIEVLNPDGTIYPWNYTMKTGWINTSLPMEKLDGLDYTKTARDNLPAFYTGEFDAVPGKDTFLNMRGWNKGFVMINGFNIGRYWSIGPQEALYVPGELLKEKNIVTVFEIHTPKSDRTLLFDDKPSLDTVKRPVFDTVTANLG